MNGIAIINKMDYCVITTHNRKQQVESLVDRVQQFFNGKIIVFDDASNDKPEFPPNIGVIRYAQNHGKKKYYLLVTDIFQMLKGNDFDRFWMIPDDVEISFNIFTESIRLWNAIKDERKVCLSVGHTHNRHYDPCWTRFKPVKMGEVVQTQWNDLCFMAERNFLEQLDYQIEKPKTGYDWRSSGVGRHISRTLHNKGWNLYHSDKSYCTFLDLPSQMHRKLEAA